MMNQKPQANGGSQYKTKKGKSKKKYDGGSNGDF
jgi:hypothetical protein